LKEEYETLDVLFAKIDLGFVERIVRSGYHEEGEPRRPPRNPLGIFKAFLVKRLLNIPSERELVRRLTDDLNLRRICEINEGEKPYGRSVLSRFRWRIEPEGLGRILDHVVRELVKGGVIEGEKVVLDATFIKA
jgi:transposase